MDDLINRQIAMDTFEKAIEDAGILDREDIATIFKIIPPEKQKTGKWLEKEVIRADEAKGAIEEWQSCKCSACGRYDTRPYMYYFSEPHYCSWCGAFNGRTEGEDHEVD